MAYANGKIKIKNAEGDLVEFYPNTKSDLISNGNETLSDTLYNLNQRAIEASQKGGIKIMYEEPNATNTASYSNKTLIGWVDSAILIPDDTWQITVDTTKLSSDNNDNKITGIPFNLNEQIGIILDVDWGDGTTSTLTNDNYTYNDDTASTHTYETAGIYEIKIKCNNWNNLYISSCDSLVYLRVNWTKSLYYFRNTLVGIDNAIPNIAGTLSISSTNTSSEGNTLNQRQFADVFLYCSKLTRIHSSLFSKLTNIFTFWECFRYCSSLNNFTIHISSPNVSIADFFATKKAGTTRTIYVPSGSTTEITFNSVASNLGLTIIPE